MRGRADRTDPRSTTAVGNGKGFVQIEVAGVGTDVRQTAETHLGVHVGTVEIDLTAVLMHDVAYLADALFEDPVGGGVGDQDQNCSSWG